MFGIVYVFVKFIIAVVVAPCTPVNVTSAYAVLIGISVSKNKLNVKKKYFSFFAYLHFDKPFCEPAKNTIPMPTIIGIDSFCYFGFVIHAKVIPKHATFHLL